MFSYMFSCVFIYYTFHIPFYFLYFLHYTCSYPFRVLHFVISIYCINVLFIYYFHIPIFMYCSFYILFSCYTFHMIVIYCVFHLILSYCTSLYFSSFSYNCLYFHRIAVLCFSYHVFYTYHFLLGFMSAYTLEADTGNNCMYP